MECNLTICETEVIQVQTWVQKGSQEVEEDEDAELSKFPANSPGFCNVQQACAMLR
jgi:hypothetical protein